MSIVTLPRWHWGDAHAPRRALLVHGLGSSAQTTWRLSEGLAEQGWSATAVDLRGHGDAPRASRYRIDDFAGDLLGTRHDDGSPWDLVVGHSIGAAAAMQAAGTDADWTRRLVLLDPALRLDPGPGRPCSTGSSPTSTAPRSRASPSSFRTGTRSTSSFACGR